VKSYTLILPLPLNKANSRMHWAVERKRRLQYFDTADLLCAKVVRQRKKYPPSVQTTLAATFYLWSSMDQDNLMARLKWPVDWLIHAGFIVDDSPAYLLHLGIPKQEIDRKYQRLVLQLTEGNLQLNSEENNGGKNNGL